MLAMGLTRIISVQTRVKKFKYILKKKEKCQKSCVIQIILIIIIASKSSN